MIAAKAHGAPGRVLEIRGLSVDTEHAQVLQGIDFSLEQGRILGIVGESGAGKSLLSKVLGRALPEGFRVSAGSLSFAGQDLLVCPASAHRDLLGKRICFVPQDAQQALNPVLSISQQFNEHFERLGLAPGSWSAMAQDALRSVQLAQPERVLGQYPHQLSGGMCQRVLLAMAFASQPDLIVCDEATTALDPATQLKIVSLLRDLQRDRGPLCSLSPMTWIWRHTCVTSCWCFTRGPWSSSGARNKFFRPQATLTPGRCSMLVRP